MFRKKSKKIGTVMGAALGTLVMFTSVSGQAAAAGKYEWPKYFNVVTPIVGTANHSLSVAWTSEFTEQTKARARVLPAPNGFGRASWLNTGEGRLALVQASDYFDQMDGAEGYASPTAGPTDTRLINMSMVTPWGYMVRGDSGIKSIHDIKPGTRIAYAASSSFLLVGIDALLAYLNLSLEDVELVEVGNYGANTSIVVEGRADVAFTSPLSGPSYEAEAGPHGIRWLALPEASENPEAFARYRAKHAGYMPMETVSGVGSAKGLRMDHGFQANHVRGDEDPEFVYQLIKWMDENYDSYKDDFTHAHMMSIDSLVRFLDKGALQPLHEGTIRYLTEKGLWKDEYQVRQDKIVALAKERETAYRNAMEAAKAEGISTEPGNEKWVEFWRQFRLENGQDRPFGEQVLALD